MSLRFFKPTDEFWNWITVFQKTTGLPVVECGCGGGELLREMRSRAIPAIGLDPRYALFSDEEIPEDLFGAILPFSAEDSSAIKAPALILVCRPCHSGFPEQVNNRRHPESLFFYVGFAHNLHQDLGDAHVEWVCAAPVGAEGENLFKVSKPHRHDEF